MQEDAMSKCRGCGKKIVWGMDEGGKRIPLDPTPPVYAEIDRDADDNLIVKRDRNAMVSHFATCPQANRFSWSKKK
jgi:hypothetical protein